MDVAIKLPDAHWSEVASYAANDGMVEGETQKSRWHKANGLSSVACTDSSQNGYG